METDSRCMGVGGGEGVKTDERVSIFVLSILKKIRYTLRKYCHEI